MIDYDLTLKNIDAHITSIAAPISGALTPDGFEEALKKALAEVSKMNTQGQLMQLKAIREVVDVAKVVSADGSWSDSSTHVFPMLTGPMSVESMTAWASMTKRTMELRTPPAATAFSENAPVVKTELDAKDPWGTGDFNRERTAS